MASRREQAGVPPYAELRRVMLQTMREMDLPASRSAVIESVADAMDLSPEQRAVSCANGTMPEYADRIGWSLTFLKQAGAIANARRGHWDLTEEGRGIEFSEIEHRVAVARAEHTRSKQQSDDPPIANEDDEVPEPDWQARLLGHLRTMSPQAFEHLSAALLRRAGFDDVEVTGRSGDGGIDGIGTYRPSGLISFRTAFQCKRYQGSVGSAAVREFRGSFAGRSDRGIIVTTGSFTSGAQAEAARDGVGPIDLIDGEALCDLLKQFELGVRVKTRTVEDIDIDAGYFERLQG